MTQRTFRPLPPYAISEVVRWSHFWNGTCHMGLLPFDEDNEDVLPPKAEDSEPRIIKGFMRCFIDPSGLDDDGLAEAVGWHIPWRWDGRWSHQTRQLMKHHGVNKLALNSNWAKTSQDWACPACGRAKQQIAYVSDGILFAQLVEHHDHFDKYVESRASGLNSEIAKQVFREKIAAMTSISERFYETLICMDCNNADGAAKSRLSLPELFSFSPYEISEFVSPSRSGRLDIDFDRAKEIYGEVGFSVEARVELINSIVRAIESGVWHYSKEDAERRKRLWVRTRWAPDASLEVRHMAEHGDTRLYWKMLHRSTQQDHVRASQTMNVRVPDAAAFAAVALQERKWAPLPNDWTCPGCGRTKHDIVRWSNKGKWTGLIYQRSDVIDVSGGFMQPYFYLICQACDVLRQDLQRLINTSDIVLHAADIRAIITDAAPYRLHTYDAEIGVAIALARQEQYERVAVKVTEANEYNYIAIAIDKIAEEYRVKNEGSVKVWADKNRITVAMNKIDVGRLSLFYVSHRKSEAELRTLWLQDAPLVK